MNSERILWRLCISILITIEIVSGQRVSGKDFFHCIVTYLMALEMCKKCLQSIKVLHMNRILEFKLSIRFYFISYTISIQLFKSDVLGKFTPELCTVNWHVHVQINAVQPLVWRHLNMHYLLWPLNIKEIFQRVSWKWTVGKILIKIKNNVMFSFHSFGYVHPLLPRH